MNIEEKIKNYKYILDKQNERIHHLNNKVGIAISIFSILYAIISLCSTKEFINKQYNIIESDICISYFVLIVTSLISFLISLYFYIVIVAPRLFGKKSKKATQKKKNILFFNDISSFASFEDYFRYTLSIDDDEYARQILEECYENAIICNIKMAYFKRGIYISYVSILLSVVCLVLSFFL